MFAQFLIDCKSVGSRTGGGQLGQTVLHASGEASAGSAAQELGFRTATFTGFGFLTEYVRENDEYVSLASGWRASYWPWGAFCCSCFYRAHGHAHPKSCCAIGNELWFGTLQFGAQLVEQRG